MMIHRRDNACVFSNCCPSSAVKTKILTPIGAPVLDGYETILGNGYAAYHFPRAEHRERRFFLCRSPNVDERKLMKR